MGLRHLEPLRRACVAASFLLLVAPAIVRAQDSGAPPPPAPAAQAPAAQTPAASASGTVLRAESSVVRVDVVVTDKKGNYIHDLTSKDFHVFEDRKSTRL